MKTHGPSQHVAKLACKTSHPQRAGEAADDTVDRTPTNTDSRRQKRGATRRENYSLLMLFHILDEEEMRCFALALTLE